MKKISKLWRKRLPGAPGQGLVEFALVLPLLILMFLGIMEVGFALYNYMGLATANREGVRFASRARYTDEMVADLVVSSSGLTELPNGDFEPNMKLTGDDANLGVIITNISIGPGGELRDITIFPIGVIVGANNEVRPITNADSRLTQDALDELVAQYSATTSDINLHRNIRSLNTLNNDLVVLETFLVHPLITQIMGQANSTFNLYFHSVMRVMRDAR